MGPALGLLSLLRHGPYCAVTKPYATSLFSGACTLARGAESAASAATLLPASGPVFGSNQLRIGARGGKRRQHKQIAAGSVNS